MKRTGADVRVVGVGGAGGNALRRMLGVGVHDAMSIAVNTDTTALLDHPADHRVVLGGRATRGLGAGGCPAAGLRAAHESSRELQAMVEGADMVFVAAGMGGGTGTGAAPLVAQLARRAGALVVGIVTVPFAFEGGRRRRVANEGLAALRAETDSLLVVENERLLALEGDEPSVRDAFSRADSILSEGVRSIGDLVMETGLINLDFADVSRVLRDGGRAVMGVGRGRGSERALRAVQQASASPLLDDDRIEGARGVLLSFRADPKIGVGQLQRAAALVQAEVDDDADILFGVTIDEDLHDEVHVTLVAAGLPEVGAEGAVSAEFEAAMAQEPRRRNALVMLEESLVPVRRRAW
ncbi:MAG: cell division protein FtsZ [Sandaracinaceae bacterium]|nr:cell division protein FtsZ [Sandaracinaceae bacterium]